MAKADKLFAILSVLLLSPLACVRTATPSPNLPAGEVNRTLTHDGLQRSYLLYVPASANRSQPLPLVLVFHGGTGNAQSAERMSGFDRVADQNGFVVVYPNGTSRVSDDILLTWNGGTCCGYAQEKNVDDTGFVRAILADLQPLVNIDAKRIYAAGMSNGGILSQRLACEAADLFAAIAPVAGTLNFPSCSPAQPVSVIEFHGTDDRHLPYDGGVGPESLAGVDFASVKDSIDFWLNFDGCPAAPQTETFADIQNDIYASCANGTAVELYTILGGRHAWPGSDGPGWPGGDLPTQSISATDLIWEFFAAHPKH